MRKQVLLFCIFLVLSAANSYAEICKSTPVVYYGLCQPLGDLKVYDGSNNLVQSQVYSETSGCTRNIYKIIISGGQGCPVQEATTLVFKLNGVTAGAAAWHASPAIVFFNLSTTGRTFVFLKVPENNVSVEDEEGIDVSRYGSGGGGEKTLSVKVPYNGTELDLVKFNTTLNQDKVIDLNVEENKVYVELGAANFSEMLVPAVKASGAVYVCMASKTMDCNNKLMLEMGQTKQGLYLEPEYRTVGSNKFYVLHGLSNGSAQEVSRPSWLTPILLIAAIIVLGAVAVIKFRKKQ